MGVVGRSGGMGANLLLGKSGINYKHHTVDGQGRLGYVCWHDNLWKWGQVGLEMIQPRLLGGIDETLVRDPVKNIFTLSSGSSANPSQHASIQIQRTAFKDYSCIFCWHLKSAELHLLIAVPSIQKCFCAIKKCSSFRQLSSSEITVTSADISLALSWNLFPDVRQLTEEACRAVTLKQCTHAV